MKPVDFKGSNIIFGEGQPEYKPLPALFLENEPGRPVVTCWEMTDEELEEVKKTKRVYFLTFMGGLTALMPQLMSVGLDDIAQGCTPVDNSGA